MSRVSSYEPPEIRVPPTRLTAVQGSQIKESPSIEVLRLALNKVVRDHGGSLAAEYRDNSSTNHKAFVAVRTTDFPAGIGLNVEGDGRVTFHYDALAGDPRAAERICGELQQTYSVIQILRALERMNFTTRDQSQTNRDGERTIFVTGVNASGQCIGVNIDPMGRVKADFAGYPAQECARDENALLNALLQQGLVLKPWRRKDKDGDGADVSHTYRQELSSSG